MTYGTLVVTGGSRGIGAATCRLAARKGWSVAVAYRQAAEAADRVVREIVDEGGAAVAIRCDVASESEVQNLFREAAESLGPVAGLVNNAGMVHRAARFVDIDLERWNRTFATNTAGAFLCAREAARRMLETGGVIVNVSSAAAVLGAPGELVDYAASKGAMESLTIGMAKELAPFGIRVNAIRPGMIETDIQADTGVPDRARKALGTIPLGRIGTADDVADAIVWLLSDEAGYVVGASIPVTGGR